MNLPQFPAHPTCALCPVSSMSGVKSIGLPTLYESSLPPSPTTPALIILGQNPGFEENEYNEAFIGRSGLMLRGGHLNLSNPYFPRRSLATEAPPDPTGPLPGPYIDGAYLRGLCSIYITNPVRCWTLGDAKPPWKNVVKPCFPYTIHDLLSICRAHAAAPKVILCVSVTAVEAVTALLLQSKRISTQATFFKQNGRSHLIHFLPPDSVTDTPSLQSESHSLTIFSTFHPAACLREPNYLHAVGGHLQMLHSFLTGTSPSVTVPNLVPPRYPLTKGPP